MAASLDGAEIGRAALVLTDPAPPPRLRVEGVPQVGATLTAVTPEKDPGSSGDAVGASAVGPRGAAGAAGVALQWLRDGAEIPGATDGTYTLTPADAGAAVSVRSSRDGRSTASAATVPVWGPPGNAAAGPNEEVLWATTMTLGSSDAFPVWVAGHARFAQASFGSLDDAAFALDGAAYEVSLAMLNGVGTLAFATAPALPSADGLALHWDGHRIGNLAAGTAYGEPLWSAPTPQPRAHYDRYWHGASDGVRVAVSLRREHPPAAATLAAVEDAVEEGGAAVFEVSVDRAPHAPLAVAVSATAQGAELSESAPASVTIAAGETTATLSLATADDAVVSGDGTVTARLLAGDGYALGDPSEATVAVTEDDAAEFSVAASPAELLEGETATVTVAIANGTTYAADREVALAVTGDVAASDYSLPATLDLPAGSSSATASFEALADDADEPRETARVAASVDGEEVGAATLAIRPAGTDATLADLALTDVDIGAFDPETTAYAGEVGRGCRVDDGVGDAGGRQRGGGDRRRRGQHAGRGAHLGARDGRERDRGDGDRGGRAHGAHLRGDGDASAAVGRAAAGARHRARRLGHGDRGMVGRRDAVGGAVVVRPTACGPSTWRRGRVWRSGTSRCRRRSAPTRRWPATARRLWAAVYGEARRRGVPAAGRRPPDRTATSRKRCRRRATTTPPACGRTLRRCARRT